MENEWHIFYNIVLFDILLTYSEIFIIKGFQTIVFIFIVISTIRLQSGLNLQPPDDCLLRSLGNQRL